MKGYNVLKCLFFFAIGAISTIFDVAAMVGLHMVDVKWVQLSTPLFVLSAIKGGGTVLVAYLIKSPVQNLGSWFNKDATGKLTPVDKDQPADVEASSVKEKVFIEDNSE